MNTLKFCMHLCDTFSDLYIEFQTSSVPTVEENHLRVCRESRYLQNDFRYFPIRYRKNGQTAFKAINLSFPTAPTI